MYQVQIIQDILKYLSGMNTIVTEKGIGDGCMKECEHVKWFAALNENVASASGLSDLYLGHPYIICTPKQMLPVEKILQYLYGQIDDAALIHYCAVINPRKWPEVRVNTIIMIIMAWMMHIYDVVENMVMAQYLHAVRKMEMF